MRQILKQTEPSDFILWKAANLDRISQLAAAPGSTGTELWEVLQSSLSLDEMPGDYSKSLLRASLVNEQYYLCCYCNDVIKGEPLDTKIEHYLPKEKYKETVFEYGNLFAACNGGERVKPVELTCDSHKKHKDPIEHNIVSPLDTDVHTHFAYRENGEVYGENLQGEQAILFFNLNCNRLRLRRKSAIEAYIYNETEEIENMISEVTQPIGGVLPAFCMAISYILECYR